MTGELRHRATLRHTEVHALERVRLHRDRHVNRLGLELVLNDSRLRFDTLEVAWNSKISGAKYADRLMLCRLRRVGRRMVSLCRSLVFFNRNELDVLVRLTTNRCDKFSRNFQFSILPGNRIIK